MSERTADEALAAIARTPWYHSIDIMAGVTTPGQWDLRGIVSDMPWPEVAGKRCLDIGTYDGFLAFELEKRGAAEVVAIDISDHTQWDWPPLERARGIEAFNRKLQPKGTGFAIAKELLESHVDRREISIYDLDPESIGTFDVVVCGDLLLHLRDPLRALEAVRGVCSGYFLSAELIEPILTLQHPRYPVAKIYQAAGPRQWSIPNAAGHAAMLTATGFAIERSARYSIPSSGVMTHGRSIGKRLRHRIAGLAAPGKGAPHQALLSRPAI